MNTDEAHRRAEALFKKEQQSHEAQQAMTEYEAELQAMRKRPRACGRFGWLETPSIRKCGPRQLEGRAGVTVAASWTK